MTVLTDFLASVKEWIDDADPSDTLATQWVRLAETRMNNELRVNEMIKRVYATFDDNCAVLPDDWLRTAYIRPQGGRPFRFLTNDAYYQQVPVPPIYQSPAPPSDWTYPLGVPGTYTNIGRTIFVWPPIDPDAKTKIEIAYWAMLPPLSDVVTPVFARYPDIYLNCTLAAGAPYLVEDERLNVYAALATQQIKTANDAAVAGRFSGSPITPLIRGFG